jgi:hypothetical protein
VIAMAMGKPKESTGFYSCSGFMGAGAVPWSTHRVTEGRTLLQARGGCNTNLGHVASTRHFHCRARIGFHSGKQLGNCLLGIA